jgi:hypothetical protein
VKWSADTKLTLSAERNIALNSEITATGTNASLALEYGQGAVAAGNTAVVNINAPVNLPAGNNFSTKLGSDGSPIYYYVITSLGAAGSTTGQDLQGMSITGNYALGANIDALATSCWNGGAGFSPIGNNTSPFTGTFNGLGHTISNLTINLPSPYYVGLFGEVLGGTISNVGLLGGSVLGNLGVGGLAGWLSGGNVTQCYTTGTVSGVNEVGGLVGYLSAGTIKQSYAMGAVSSTKNYVGGLVGKADGGTVTQSYATGSVLGVVDFGGLVGINTVGMITHSYWDTTTTGRVTSDGSGSEFGKTTAEMKSLATYAEWDISATGGEKDLANLRRSDHAVAAHLPYVVDSDRPQRHYVVDLRWAEPHDAGNGYTCVHGVC